MNPILFALILQLHPQLPSWALGEFVRVPKINPIFQASPSPLFNCPMAHREIAWQAGDVFNPASTVKGGKLDVLFRSEDASGVGIGMRTSRIGLAVSSDGIRYAKRPTPVVFPAPDSQAQNEWPGGCEDPRVVVTKDGLYVMAYTQWNRVIPRLAIATSRDLIHWNKFGPAFRDAYQGKFIRIASKSASIVTELEGGKQVAVKLHGKYWMYWGEDGVHAATSEDLTSWTPVVDSNGELESVIKPRRGFFDSALTECGPPAVRTSQGIVLLYNGKNLAGADGDPRFASNSYCAGQVLISNTDPMKALGRLDLPFFKPEEPYEKSGQYAAGTVFVEGLSFFRRKWWLFYGCADSRVAVAVFDPSGKKPK
jgi:predicted GH43/DUF377 family glycosyl hydrolase